MQNEVVDETRAVPVKSFSVTAEIFEHIFYAAMRLQRMPQLFVDRNLVRVATPDLGNLQKGRFNMFGHNFLHHSLGDPHQDGHFTQRELRVALETQKHVSVVRQKRPAHRFREFCLDGHRQWIPGISFLSFFHDRCSCV